MSYRIFFGNRYIDFLSVKDIQSQLKSNTIVYCKNKKSFDKVYQEFKKDQNISFLEIHTENDKALFRHFAKQYKRIKATGGLVFNDKNEILIIKRNGVWDLPKGKLEKGEKRKEAALREVREECGIHNLAIVSKIGKTYHTYNIADMPVLKLTYWYKMNAQKAGETVPQTEEGITEIKWVNRIELSEIIKKTWPNLKCIMEEGLKD